MLSPIFLKTPLRSSVLKNGTSIYLKQEISKVSTIANEKDNKQYFLILGEPLIVNANNQLQRVQDIL